MANIKNIKAVIFDIGGVVLRSPILSIYEYEKEHGIPKDYLNILITKGGPTGPWAKFERGEMDILTFYRKFGEALSDTEKGNAHYKEHCKKHRIACPSLPTELEVDGRELFGRMNRGSSKFDENVVRAIHAIRGSGKYRVIALTNNFTDAYEEILEMPKTSGFSPARELAFLGWQDGPAPKELRSLFDDFIDSSSVGKRKPEPEFYLYACEKNNVKPSECVFLDDLGINLKAAKKLGMHTIQVPIDESAPALRELEHVLGLPLSATSSNADSSASARTAKL